MDHVLNLLRDLAPVGPQHRDSIPNESSHAAGVRPRLPARYYVAIPVSIDDDPPHVTHHLLESLPCDGASLLLCAYDMIRPN